MSDNPYEPPLEPARIDAPVSDRKHLRSVAVYQRWIQIGIPLHLVFVGLSAAVRNTQSQEFLVAINLGLLVTWFAGAILAFLLALKLYAREAAVLLGLLACVPIFGLVVTLFVNSKANSTLLENGLHVGFLGVQPSRI